MRSSTHGPSKLYVGDLGKNRKADLARLFRKYGEITTIYCDENKHFAFIEFSSATDAQRALEHTNNRTVNGSKLRVEFAKSDKPARLDPRRAFSRDRSPAPTLFDDLQFTANRLPSMQTFRYGHHQSNVNHPPTSLKSSPRGRSLTPPSLKNNPRFSAVPHGRTADVYHSTITSTSSSHHYLEPNHHRNVDDPYSMQRLPPSAFQRTTHSSTRNHRRSRSRSHHRTSPSHRHQNNREKKRKRRSRSSSSSSSSNQKQRRERGPRTPPPPITDRTSPESNIATSPLQEQSSLNSPSDNEEKSSKSRRKSIETESNRKHSKRKMRE